MTTLLTRGHRWAGVLLGLAVGTAHGQVTVVVQTGDAAPGGAIYRRLPKKPAVSDAAVDQAAFIAGIQGGAGPSGVFAEDDDATMPGTTIALKDQPSPTTAQFTRFSSPSINATSRVAFAARIRGGSAGVFQDGVSTVALKLDDAPTGAGTAFFDSFAGVAVTDAGDVVWQATLGNAPVVLGVSINEGIYRCAGGASPNCSSQGGGTDTLTAVALVGDRSVPLNPLSPAFCDLGEFRASNFGIVMRASTKVDCADPVELSVEGIFRISFGGTIDTLAMVGASSEPNPGVTFYQSLDRAPAIANNGTVAFYSIIGSLGADGIYVCDAVGCPATAPAVVVQAGVSSASDQPPDNDLTRISSPGVSDAGDVVFRASVVSAAGRLRAILVYRDATGLIETLALKDDLAPTEPADPLATFRSFQPPVMSPGGRVGFIARIRGSSGGARAIYVVD